MGAYDVLDAAGERFLEAGRAAGLVDIDTILRLIELTCTTDEKAAIVEELDKELDKEGE